MGQILHKIRTNRKFQLLILLVIIAIGLLAYSYFKANPVMPPYFCSNSIGSSSINPYRLFSVGSFFVKF